MAGVIENYIQLVSVDGIGCVSIKKLIDYFGNIESIFRSDPEEISAASGLDLNKSEEILRLPGNPSPRVIEEIEKIKDRGYHLYYYGLKGYPRMLAEIYDPPVVLYSRGELRESDINAVAIVGTRRATQYGRRVARYISRDMASNNITVISGCAVGIDTIAHKGALENGGRTIAVLGSGLDVEYPPENAKLMEEIAGNGAVVSEFPAGTEPKPYNFPLRNRIISGLSLGVVVVEAPGKSGALITAVRAAEQGRAVYAVPGSVFSSKSKGCNKLIKQGAIPVSMADEILQDISPMLHIPLLKKREKEFVDEKISDDGKKILDILSGGEFTIDEISEKSKIDISTLAKALTDLEMIGVVSQGGGKRYIKNGKSADNSRISNKSKDY
ncbi:MAG: DNA-processing protein DprA [Elusimicrobiota bacterium]